MTFQTNIVYILSCKWPIDTCIHTRFRYTMYFDVRLDPRSVYKGYSRTYHLQKTCMNFLNHTETSSAKKSKSSQLGPVHSFYGHSSRTGLFAQKTDFCIHCAKSHENEFDFEPNIQCLLRGCMCSALCWWCWSLSTARAC